MLKKISVSFDPTWILTRKDDTNMPVDAFIAHLGQALKIKVIYDSVMECEILINEDGLGEAALLEKVTSVIMQTFQVSDIQDVAQIAVQDYVEQEPIVLTNEVSVDEGEQVVPEVPEAPEKAPKEDPVEAAYRAIDNLVGAEEFKSLAAECVKVAPGLLKHKTVEVFTRQSLLVAINDGNGLSTYLQMYANLLSALGLFQFQSTRPIAEVKLHAPDGKREPESAFEPVYKQLSGFMKNGGKLICIDISEWMTKTTDKPFRDFLSKLDDFAGEHLFVFRVPFVEKEIMTKLQKTLSDVLLVRQISFVPFDCEELEACAQRALEQRGFTIEPDAWKVFHARIGEEKTDGRFYGINTVNKVVYEMIYRKQLHNAMADVDDTVVKKSEIQGLAVSYSDADSQGLELLSQMVGMEAIRDRVEEIVAQIEMTRKNEKLGSPCIHMRFVGSPGTGKTTVARVVGQILKEKGILRNGNFFEYSGRDFCGRYVGETAPKTAAMCRDAYGSVLFIDEAYTLYRNTGYSSVDYGREAIDTLIAEMENHRSDLVVIMAGYTDEMADLMKANAGLESRMPYVIEFPNYTRQQLTEIFMRMARKSFTIHKDMEEAVGEYFAQLPEEVIASKEFSNARFVRNLFERTWGKTVLRAQMNKTDPTEITKEDFLLASAEKEFKKIMPKQTKTLGFIY